MEHSRESHAPAADGRDYRDALVVYASKGKTVRATLYCFTFTVAVVVLPWVLGPEGPDRFYSFYNNPILAVLMQIAGGVLGSIMTVRTLTILFSAAPRVVVSHEGIWVNSLVFGSAIFPWAEIAGLLVVGHRFPRVAILVIVLHDRQALRSRQNRLQELLWRLGGFALVWPQEVTVPDNLLPMSAAELVGRIHVHFEHELVQHGIQVHGA